MMFDYNTHPTTKPPHFNGPCYDPALDLHRLTHQLNRIYSCMIDGVWRTLPEIAKITSDPEASISAQLRHLRKSRFGSYVVNKRRRDERAGLWEYQLLKPAPVEDSAGQRLFFTA